MANEKISAMPAPSFPLGGTELFPLVQSAANDAIAFSDLVAQIGLAGAFVTGAQVPANEADPIFNAWLISTPPLFPGGAMNFDSGAIFSDGAGLMTARQVNVPGGYVCFGTTYSDPFLSSGSWAGSATINFNSAGIYVPLPTPTILDAGSITTDGAGNLIVSSLSAGNGFTGTGAYTNFTISGGIITAAS